MSHSPTRLELVTCPERFLGLEREWNELLQSSPSNSVFLTFEYLSTWWEVYGKHSKLRIVTARNEGKLVGAAPFAIGPGSSGPRRWLRHLSFLGTCGDELPEFLDILAAPGHEEELTGRFLSFAFEELRPEWDVFYLDLVPAESRLLSSLIPVSGRQGFPARLLEPWSAPYLPLPRSWDELLRAKSKNFRKQFSNHWNRLFERHQVEVLQAGKDLGIDETFDLLLHLNQRRWGADGTAFTSARTRTFHRALAHRFHRLGWLCFLVMKIDGVPAAVRFDYVYDGKLWNIQGGWNPDHARLSPGRMLIGWQIQRCIEQGLREYDFLAGEADYKRSWATHERKVVNAEVLHPESCRTRVFQALRHLRGGLRRLKPEPAAGAPELPAPSA